MMTTDERIEEYKNAYFACHKRYPVVRKKGAWLYINDGFTAHRSSDLPKMALRLIEMAAKKLDDELRPKKQDPEYFEVKYPLNKKWKKDIDDHVIVMFLDELHRRCAHSAFKMERFMKNFVTGGSLSDCDFENNLFECDSEKCELVESLELNIDIKDRKISVLKQDLADKEAELRASKKLNRELRTVNKKYKDDYNHLKENSVLFSMDHLEEKCEMIYDDIDDDIPF